MAIQSCTKALARCHDGQLWYIYNNADALEYKVFANGKFTSEGICITKKVLGGFAAEMDERGNVHILCQSLSNELMYWHYNGRQWDKQTLTKYDPARYIMKYPVLKLIGSDIHVVFAMGNVYKTTDWMMYHYLWHKTQWKTLRIGSLNIGNLITPFQIDLDAEENIHLIYRDRDEKKLYRTFYAFFDGSFRIWSKPQPLKPDDRDSNWPTLLVDGDTMHLAWNNTYNNRICVEYAVVPLNKRREISINKSSVVSPDNADAQRPLLCTYDNKLWLAWVSDNAINSIYSDDRGITWRRHDPVNIPNNSEPQCFRYLDQRFPNLGLVYGFVDSGFKLVPPIPLSEPAGVENSVQFVTSAEAGEKALDEFPKQVNLSQDIENITTQLDMIKAQQNDLLQLLSKSDRHLQDISAMLEGLTQLLKGNKSKSLHKAGFMSAFKQWLSK